MITMRYVHAQNLRRGERVVIEEPGEFEGCLPLYVCSIHPTYAVLSYKHPDMSIANSEAEMYFFRNLRELKRQALLAGMTLESVKALRLSVNEPILVKLWNTSERQGRYRSVDCDGIHVQYGTPVVLHRFEELEALDHFMLTSKDATVPIIDVGFEVE